MVTVGGSGFIVTLGAGGFLVDFGRGFIVTLGSFIVSLGRGFIVTVTSGDEVEEDEEEEEHKIVEKLSCTVTSEIKIIDVLKKKKKLRGHTCTGDASALNICVLVTLRSFDYIHFVLDNFTFLSQSRGQVYIFYSFIV